MTRTRRGLKTSAHTAVREGSLPRVVHFALNGAEVGDLGVTQMDNTEHHSPATNVELLDRRKCVAEAS